MLIGLLKTIGIFYYWTWFIWPFVFVGSLVRALSSANKCDGVSHKHVILASVSLLIILAGITYSTFS